MQYTYQSQNQNQKQGYYLSIQHRQLMHLLHLSGYNLDEYLQNQLEENPLLELSEKNDEPSTEPDVEMSDKEVFDEEFFQEDYANDYEEKIYSTSQNTDEQYEAPVVQLESFTDQLKEQIDLMNITEEERNFANYIVDELDDDGYLKRSNIEIGSDYGFRFGKLVDESKIENAIRIVQRCEPVGIGARNLQECLLLQLNGKNLAPAAKNAKTILQSYYDKLTARHFQAITSALSITENEFKEALTVIKALNPKPNTCIDRYELFKSHISPTFEVMFDGNEFSITITGSKYGNLTVTQTLEEFNKDSEKSKTTKPEKKYWEKMATEAHCLIEAIKQREKTMMAVMRSIIKLQSDFFKFGEKRLLKPMILEQVANMAKCDISTVSRITSNKYVQTGYGCFLLKNLFSSSLQAANDEQVSSHKVKELIEDIIKQENKQNPLTDNQIVESLKGMDISIARRTVVKYRDMIGIPSYSMRTA